MLASRRALLLSALAHGLTAALPAHAQVQALTLFERIARTRNARIAGDAQAWYQWGRSTLELAPDHPDLMISLARAAAATGRTDEAYLLLGDAARRGAGFDVVRFAELSTLDFSGGARSEIAETALRNLAPVARATHFADLPAEQCEGVAYDPRTKRCFAGSGDGRIFAVSDAGVVTTFAEGLAQVLGLKIDARRRRLWAVSGRFPNQLPEPNAPPSDAGFTGLRVFDIDTGAPAGAWDLDERPAVLHGFNDMALARGGEVYITDSPTGLIYKLTSAGKLEVFFRSDALSFVNGIVISRNQRRLYVAHTEGLSSIEIADRTLKRLALPSNASVHGIDGLAWLGRDLVAVQGSPYFARIARIELDHRGESIVAVSTLNSRTPAEYQQTTCAVADGWIVAVGGSPTVNPYGGPPLAPSPKPHLVRIPIGSP